MLRSPEAILIASNHPLDRGGEFPRALERRNIRFDIVDLNHRLPPLNHVGGVIALGGPLRSSNAQVQWYGDVIKSNRPGLGMCVALQSMGKYLGGEVVPGEPEMGFVSKSGTPFRPNLTIEGHDDPYLSTVHTENSEGVVFEFHTHMLIPKPETTLVVARGENDVVQAIRAIKADGSRGRMLGVQYHPDVKEREDLDTFIAIYQDVFQLNENVKKVLLNQFEQYQERNVGPQLIDNLFDDMFGAM